MEAKKTILSFIDKIIKACISVCVYSSECNSISTIFANEIQPEIMKLPDNIDNEETNLLITQLKKLHTIVDNFKNEDWAEAHLQISITEPTAQLKELMDSIIETLKKLKIEVTGKFDDSPETVSQDLKILYGLYSDPKYYRNLEVQRKLQKIEAYLNDNKQPLFADVKSKEIKDFENEIELSQCKVKQEDNYEIREGFVKSTKKPIFATFFLNGSIEKFNNSLHLFEYLHHPYLENLVGFVNSDENHIIVTEKSGNSLHNILMESPEELDGLRTKIAFKIAIGMSYLHSKKVIHRDLCAENVFLNNSDPKISNFTNSRVQPDDNFAMTNIKTYTNPFRAPEMSSDESYDEKVDVFAFSGILYELLTNKSPFQSLNPENVAKSVNGGKRPDIENYGASESLKTLIANCWNANSNYRKSFILIVDEMISKKIAFPGEEEVASEFYDKISVKNKLLNDCIDNFKKAGQNASVVFEYIRQSNRVKSYIYSYLFLLETSVYAACNDIDENISFQLKNLNENLTELNEILESACCVSMLENPVDFIPNKLNSLMENIYKIMIELKLDATQYHPVESDELNDYREFYYDFECKQAEIVSIIKKKGSQLNLSENEIHESLSKFASSIQKYRIDINDYDIENKKPIGSGMSSDVYLVEPKKGGDSVVIKEFSKDFFITDYSLRLVIRELKFLTSLSHEYICKIIGFNDDVGQPLRIFLPKATNGSLDKVIDQLYPFDKTKIAYCIACGMEYLHSKGVIHRDLKLSNVLLEGTNPLIADFGYARPETSSNYTAGVGTEKYAAKEVLNSEIYSLKADVYSFGAMLWEMYAKQPFTSKDFDFPYPISNDLKELINNCLSDDPSKRPSFIEIIDLMREKKIAFDGADEDQVTDFYSNADK